MTTLFMGHVLQFQNSANIINIFIFLYNEICEQQAEKHEEV